jgi:hypothetical protein
MIEPGKARSLKAPLPLILLPSLLLLLPLPDLAFSPLHPPLVPVLCDVLLLLRERLSCTFSCAFSSICSATCCQTKQKAQIRRFKKQYIQ